MDGGAIAIARAAIGMTQKDLAEKVGITQAALSRYENNDRNTDEVILSKMGEVLGVEFSAFENIERPERGPLAADAHMRRRKSAPVGEWRKSEARLNLIRLEIGLISRRMEIDPTLVLPYLPSDEYSPEEAAQRVRALWGMPTGPVRQIYRWVEAAGVFAVERDLSTAKVDGLSQVIDGVAVMLINSEFPSDRKRLTIAHELGHIVMHSGHHIPDDPEGEANAFAAEFLMPREIISPYLRSLELGSLRALKIEWGVSMQALFERAFRLGKATPQQRTSFYKKLNRYGWKVKEPDSELLPRETPQLLNSIEKSLTSAGFSHEEFGRITGVTSEHPDSVFSQPVRRNHLRLVSD